MGKYILKRLGMMVLTMFFIMTIGFCALHAMPGGDYPADVTYGFLDDVFGVYRHRIVSGKG